MSSDALLLQHGMISSLITLCQITLCLMFFMVLIQNEILEMNFDNINVTLC